ncbi:MAG TPA: hypothetical protein VKT28_02285 [Puia sp.]|nr:hypothetical protein [Puia sp.]
MIKSFIKTLRRFFGNLYVLVFLNGFLLASLFYLKIESNYENNLFSVIQKSIDKKIDPNDTKDSVLMKVMQTCSNMLGNRASIFAGSTKDLEGFKTDFFHPATVDLMTANGACGSYSLVLARVMQNYHFPIRIDQMKANGKYASHNIIEVNVSGKWIVLDPLYDLCFIKPGGVGLASFDDVRSNWAYYSKQLPQGYDTAYRYEDVRYSNWEKVPIILPAIKKMLDLVLGKQKADTISLRVHFLRMYDFYFYVALFFFVPIAFLTIRKIIKKKQAVISNQRSSPVNSNQYINQSLETAN